MNTLITGAAGFIGFHLAKHLAEKGIAVSAVDNFNSYYDPSLKRARAEELKKIGVVVEEIDICDRESLEKRFEFSRFTHIVHLAAQAGVRYSLENPHAYVKSNIDGFLHILELCRAYPQAHLTYASSSSVYGLNEKTPYDVQDRTDHQASLYGVTKKCNELMASTYRHLYGLRCTGLRFFTVYGPWGRPDMAYYKFARSMIAGEPIDLYNNGKMLRDFTYIDDIVDGITAAMERRDDFALYNLGNHRPEKLATLVELLERHLGIKAHIRLLPMQAGDVVATYAEIEESSRALGFQPKVSLDEGIGRFVAWYNTTI